MPMPSRKTLAMNWLRSPGSSDSRLANSLACLKCHNLGPQSFAIHALPPERLAGITRRALQEKSASERPLPLEISALMDGHPKNRQAAQVCATCHVEHRGKKNDLIRLTDLQCQSCHALQFASFSNGHPPFTISISTAHSHQF